LANRTDTHLLLRAFVDELARCGIAGACTSPGSRSTPIVAALVRDGRFPTWSHVDERVAAFFAVGAAKASGAPVAIACTSGTAAANYLPAVIEARHAGVPLLVLTADRPPELRDVGAGQTIDQLELYGGAVKWFFEVGAHEATPDALRWIRALACRAVDTARAGRPGPVHLNFALREPLVTNEPLPPDPTGRADGAPWSTLEARPASPPTLPAARRPVIVAGRGAASDCLPALAAASDMPVLADPLSQARSGPAAIAHYDALLRHDAFAQAQRPDLVVRAGDLPTSKPLRQWLAGLDCEQVAFTDPGVRHDPDSVVTRWIEAPPGWEAAPAGDSNWLGAWRAADEQAAQALRATLGDDLNEPNVACALAALAPDTIVWTASSMPVREIETFWPALDDPPRVLAHRGANGIDGTVAAAFGAAAATGGRVVLHIGDVALAHDLGALLCASRLRIEITIVLVDNAGGGIFDFLPVATQTDILEEHVATPTGLDARRVADLFGLRYTAPASLADLRDELAAPAGGLIHVRTDRAANVALHRRCWDAVRAHG
jgi:2-succinyl-5-enolpyruvyl-6-hydroxy-3-cyclohexene-1-carboxylate synthase